MKRMRASAPLALVTAAIVATLTTATITASADLVVPGYVETCTMEKQAKKGEECHSCAAYHGNHTHCPDSLASYGFTQRCRSGGASVWSEIWCRPASASAKTVPKDILGQLSNSSSKIKPGPGAPGTSAPAPSDAPTAMHPAFPAPPTAPPTAAPAPTSAPTATPSDPPAPPPTPPPQGCACTAGGESTAPLTAALLATGAAIVTAARRRRSR